MSLALALGVSCSGTRGVATSTQGAVAVSRTTTEGLVNPLGIDANKPRLSWALDSAEREQVQTAYQIVADLSGGGQWDSGQVASAQQTSVRWGGPALQSGQRVTWRVRIWDRYGRASDFSAQASFEMGLLAKADWKGRWIAAEEKLDWVGSVPMPQRGAKGKWIWAGSDVGELKLTTAFDLPDGKQIAGAHAVFAGDDDFVLSINGTTLIRGGALFFESAQVASALHAGSNTVTVAAKNVAGAAGVLGRIVVEFVGGGKVDLVTTPDWKAEGGQAVREVKRPVAESPRLRVHASPAPFLRRSFAVAKPVKTARAYVAGAGYAELHVNGAKVSDHVLDPAFTAFDKRIIYVTHDVTAALKVGPNVIGVVLGNGFYNQHAQDVWDSHLSTWRATPRVRVDLRIDYQDGSTQTVASDEQWQVATGPIVMDGVRVGEDYDARRELQDWDRPGGSEDTSQWKPAKVVVAPAQELNAQAFAPVKVMQTLKAVRLSQPRQGLYVFDFGQNTAGWARLKVKGTAGSRVVMRYGEKLSPEGALDQGAIDHLIQQGPFQTDSYVLKGQGTETWEPRFTYHGFQYVEVTGFPGQPTLDSLEARVVHTAFEQKGSFESSSPLLGKLWDATNWAYRSNFVSIPTDCPQREKNGWTADAHLAAEQAMFVWDNGPGYEKWLRDVRYAMKPDGALPGIVPTGGWGYAWGNGPAWDSALFVIPWYLYLYSGDSAALEDSYEHMKRYVDYVGTRDYLSKNPSGWLGDWVPWKDKTPEAVTHAGYHVFDARLVAQVARRLGKTDEAAHYEKIAEAAKSAFVARHVEPETGKLSGVQQTALASSLYQGLLDGKARTAAVAALVGSIESKGLDTGVLGAKFVPWVLTEAGRADLFYKTLTRTEAPGWGAWIAQGATTLWEDWKGNDSRNHVFFGDIVAWYFRALAGINPDPAAPGFAHILFQPEVVGGLNWVRAQTRTERGVVASEWRREGATVTFKITVPVNSTATVAIPAATATQVSADGGRFLRSEGGRQLYSVGSGSYLFVVR